MNRTLKIFVACALGGGIGTFVALQLNTYFWWLGLIAGGFVGYIGYDIKAVALAIPEAWHRTSHYFGDKQKRAKVFWISIACISFLSTFAVFNCLSWLANFPSGDKAQERLFMLNIMLFLITLLGFVFRSMLPFESDVVKNAKRLVFFLSPPAYFIYWPFKFAVLVFQEFLMPIWEMIKSIPGGFIGLCKFTKTVFVLIHSEFRLLCMLDAALGAGIGYWFGSALIGALAGGAFGVFNYQIISKWWLKLAPANK